MAQAWIDRYECDREGKLPHVCMKCGAEGVRFIKRTFQWYPPWILLTIFLGLLPWVVLAMVLTKKMKVYVPLCAEHRSYFSRRVLVGGLLIIAGLVIVTVGIIVGITLAVQPQAKNEPFVPCCGGLFLFCVAVLVASIVMQSGIKPAEITDDDIKLNGVSEGFVEALKDDRRARKDERDRRRAEDDENDRPRRRQREDYDDKDDR